MRLLLDTHVALWSVSDRKRLSPQEVQLIETADDLAISVVVIWEIAIKYALRRGRHDDMPISGGQALEEFDRAGISILPVSAIHAAAVDDLPPLHGDPFDRMLIAQATIEGMRLMTHDARLKGYGAMILLV